MALDPDGALAKEAGQSATLALGWGGMMNRGVGGVT